MGPILIFEIHSDEVMFETGKPTNDTIGLCDVWPLEDHPRRRKGDMVTQERSSVTHLLRDRVKGCLFRNHNDLIDALSH